jgi:transposase
LALEAHVIHPTSIPVWREHRRAKSDRIDTALLMRSLLGWLRGERKHCSMAAIPSLAEEDARRPNREHESLVGERSRIVNRLKATMIRLGIGGFNVKLRKAAAQLTQLRTAAGEPIPPNTLAELGREIARYRFICDQIKAIEQERLERLKRAPQQATHAMLLMLAKILGIGIETADMLVHEVLSRHLRDSRAVGHYAGITGAPDEVHGDPHPASSAVAVATPAPARQPANALGQFDYGYQRAILLEGDEGSAQINLHGPLHRCLEARQLSARQSRCRNRLEPAGRL